MGPSPRRVPRMQPSFASSSKRIRGARLNASIAAKNAHSFLPRKLLLLGIAVLIAVAWGRASGRVEYKELADVFSVANEYRAEMWHRTESHTEVAGESPSILERYLNAMNDPTEYHDSDFAFTPEVQEALFQHQNPQNCESAKFLIYYVWSHGFGSFVRGMSSAFALAVSQGRVLLLAVGPAPRYKRLGKDDDQVWKTWHHGIGCNHVHPECFFKPISNCSLKSVHERMIANEVSYAELESDVDMPVLRGNKVPRVLVARGKLNWLVGVRRHLPVTAAIENLRISLETKRNEYFGSENKYIRNRIWSVQSYVYLLRLNERMQHLVRPALEKCFPGKHPKYDHIIGIPVRGTDKCYREENGTRHGEAHCVSLNDTLKFASRIHASNPWIDTLLVTSEDKSVVKDLSGERGMTLGSDSKLKWNLLTNVADVQQGTGRSYSSMHVNVGTSKERSHLLVPANITESILTTLACQVLPSHHILLLRSNFADTIDLLSKAVPGRRSGASINVGTPVFPS